MPFRDLARPRFSKYKTTVVALLASLKCISSLTYFIDPLPEILLQHLARNPQPEPVQGGVGRCAAD
jgi:hypothetical protein